MFREWRHGKARMQAHPKAILRLPDLEHSKAAVLNSLTSPISRRSYDHASREFTDWYCSEPRLAFNKTVVTRYRIFLEQAHYAASTINLRLAAVRRLAYEACDAGLLSPDLAACIRRVKGVRMHGVSNRQLADPRPGPDATADFRPHDTPRETRSRNGRGATGLWASPCRTCSDQRWEPPAPGGALGVC